VEAQMAKLLFCTLKKSRSEDPPVVFGLGTSATGEHAAVAVVSVEMAKLAPGMPATK
jgi:hypothetical protein